MMKDYRINLRLRTDIPEEAKIAEYLSTIKKSRNRFIINALAEYMEKDNRLLENIRSIFREEIRNVSLSAGISKSEPQKTEFTEETEESAKLVLEALEMFC